MRGIWQGDILIYINEELKYRQNEMDMIIREVGKDGDHSQLNRIIKGKSNKGIEHENLNTEYIYEKFFASKIDGQTERQLNIMLEKLDNFLKERGIDTSRFEKKSSGYEAYVKSMLDYGLIEYKLPEDLSEAKVKHKEKIVSDDYVKITPRLHSQNFTATADFIGRGDILDKMAELLHDVHTVVLRGLGGIGKTCLSNQYVVYHKDEYENIQAIRYGDTIRSFRQLILALNFDGLNESELEEEAKFYQRKKLLKEMDSSTLLIFDNIDDKPEDLAIFEELRRESKIHIIITTRLAGVFNPVYTIPVGVLEDGDQLILFEKYYKKRVTDDMKGRITELLNYIEGHTLLIELIARSMDEGELSCEEMEECLSSGEDTEDLPNVRFQKDGSQDSTMWRFVRKILFNIEPLPEKQKSTLRLLTLLPADGISRRLFFDLLPGSKDHLRELESKSWSIKETDSISNITRLHPVIREVAREELVPTCKNCDTFLENLCCVMKSESGNTYTDDLCKLGLSIVDTIDFRKEPCPKYLDYLITIADFLRHRKEWRYRYQELLNVYTCALELWENGEKSCFRSETPIELHREIGWCYQQLADYSSAMQHFKLAVHYSSEGSISRARSYRKLGEVCRKASKYQEALKYDQLALDIFTETYDVAEVTNAIGVVYLNMGKPKEAMEHYQEAYKMWEECSDLNLSLNLYKQLAYTTHNIGTAYHKLGDFREAAKYHEEALKLRESHEFEERERDMTASYTWLGKDYTKLGDMERSKEYIDESLKLRKKLLGENHPDYAWALDTLSCWYEQQNKLKEAISTMDKVIEIRKTILGENHKYTKEAMDRRNELAALL